MDWVHNFLTTTDFEEVEEPLLSAIQTFDKNWIPKESKSIRFIETTMSSIMLSDCVYLKRYLWLLIMIVSPGMQSFVKTSCSKGPEHAQKWIECVSGKIKELVSGEADGIEIFLSHLTVLYISSL